MEDLYLAKGINVSSRIINNVAYIYLEDRNDLISLNETGSEVWRLVNGKRRTSDIVDHIIKCYDAEPCEVRDIIYSFILDLIGKGALKTSSVPFEGVMAYG